MNRDEYNRSGARLKCPRGEDQGLSKLTDENVKTIRALHELKKKMIADLNEQFSVKAQAKRYNVHPRTIEKALRYESWRHVSDKAEALRGAV